jgi:hypothetical protein
MGYRSKVITGLLITIAGASGCATNNSGGHYTPNQNEKTVNYNVNINQGGFGTLADMANAQANLSEQSRKGTESSRKSAQGFWNGANNNVTKPWGQ